MNCRTARERLADTIGKTDPPEADLDLDLHLANCAACAALAADAREAHAALGDFARAEALDDAPPVQVAAVLRHAVAAPAERLDDPLELPPRARALPAWGRIALRAAVVLLACVGGLALLQARVEAGEGRVVLSLALPGAAADPPPAHPPAPRRIGPTPRVRDDGPAIAGASREEVEQVVESALERHVALAPERIEASVRETVREALRPEFRAVAEHLVLAEERQARSIVELLNVLEHQRAEGTESLALAFQELMRREIATADRPEQADPRDTPR